MTLNILCMFNVYRDIQGVWESRRHFNKISSDLDMALNRNSQVSKTKPVELKEAQNLLQATTTCFRYI